MFGCQRHRAHHSGSKPQRGRGGWQL